MKAKSALNDCLFLNTRIQICLDSAWCCPTLFVPFQVVRVERKAEVGGAMFRRRIAVVCALS